MTSLERQRTRATWVSRREVSFLCLDFSGFKADPAGLLAEIEASDQVIRQQPPGSLLLAIDLNQAQITPELAAYFQTLFGRSPNPLRKVAVVGLSGWQRVFNTTARHIPWPQNAAFFQDWEEAKAWLIGERR